VSGRKVGHQKKGSEERALRGTSLGRRGHRPRARGFCPGHSIPVGQEINVYMDSYNFTRPEVPVFILRCCNEPGTGGSCL
jgi:hypothetical protein